MAALPRDRHGACTRSRAHSKAHTGTRSVHGKEPDTSLHANMYTQMCRPTRAQCALHPCSTAHVTHTGTHLRAQRRTAVHAHAQSTRLPPLACDTHSLGSDPQGTHEHALVNRQGHTQTLLHRRARTHVCTPRARARTEPPACTASRKALASPPLPLHRRAGWRGGGGVRTGQVEGAEALSLPRLATASPFRLL